MFKTGRARPVIEADTKTEVLRLAEQHLSRASPRTISTELRSGPPWVRAISNTQLSAVL